MIFDGVFARTLFKINTSLLTFGRLISLFIYNKKIALTTLRSHKIKPSKN